MKNQSAFLTYKSYKLRLASLIQTGVAGSGHPTSCLSAADIVAALFFYGMKYDPLRFEDPGNDRFILSKGHASALLYAVWHELGLLTHEDLLTYRTFGSPLEGHPTRRFAYADAATGSLGMGLGIGLGYARAAQMRGFESKVYVLLGDAELAEGSIWEAVALAAHDSQENLIAIVDCNRLGQSNESLFGHAVDRYKAVFESWGWDAIVIDGHDVMALMSAYDHVALSNGKPRVILAKTFKGYGVSLFEDHEGFHGKALVKEELKQAIEQLQLRYQAVVNDAEIAQKIQQINKPKSVEIPICNHKNGQVPTYQKGELVATRKAIAQALVSYGEGCACIVVLDADVKNSTYTELFQARFPLRFIESFVAEQNMVSMAVGLDRAGFRPFVATFASFLTRAHDQLRMAAIGKGALRVIGTHAGISIGQDGPSQMGLEDIGMMKTFVDSVVLYPSDAVAAHHMVGLMNHYTKGISYVRATRGVTPVLYDVNECFEIGGCKILRQSNKDVACVIAAGITLFEALKAYDLLQKHEEPRSIAIIDLYSIKPFDQATIKKIATASNGVVITVEDHYYEGGFGQMIAASLVGTPIKVQSLAVCELPCSGASEDLLSWARIDSLSICETVLNL